MFNRLVMWIMDKRAMRPGQVRRYRGKKYEAVIGNCEGCAFNATGCYSFKHKMVLGCCIQNRVCFKEVGRD